MNGQDSRTDGRFPVEATSRSVSESGLPLWGVPLRPLVDLVASLQLGVHAKLLSGFLAGAVLLVGMAILSLVVMHRMTLDVAGLAAHQDRVDRARQMIYSITSQSHFRAMALLTGDSSNNTKIATAKAEFTSNLDYLGAMGGESAEGFFAKVRADDTQFAESSAQVLDLYQAGDIDTALKMHLAQEHPISHVLEAEMRELIQGSTAEMTAARAAFEANRRLLTNMVWGFSGASLALAILLGVVMSLAFVRPVRRIDRVVARVAAGDFTQRVEVRNRDEFGTLSRNVNGMSQQLSNLYEKLRQELAQRTKAEEELERRAVALEATNKELEAFSYSVSHDLRGPLRSIDGFSQALLEDYGEKLDASGQEYLTRVRSASQRMGQLIDDLLGLSRTTRAKMEVVEVVNLSEIAEAVTAELRQRHSARQVECAIAAGVTARGDGKLLKIVLENLLGNAWKFTGKQPQARVEFGVTEHEGKTAYFVRDNGAGFDMAYADKLFGAFQRLHKADEFEGSGIGLATVQRIIRRHGGRVWAEGAVGQGATFYFTF